MSTPEHGGILYVLNQQTWSMVQQRLRPEGTFTDTVPAVNYHSANDDLVLILHETKMIFAGLISSGGHGVTGRRRIQIKDLVPLHIPVEALRKRLSLEASARLDSTVGHEGGTINSKAWTEIWDTLCQLTSQKGAQDLRNLEAKSGAGKALTRSQLEQVLAFDRDSVGLAVDVAGFDRRDVLKRLPTRTHTPENAVRHLELCAATEDSIIIHDARRFPGFPSTLSESIQGGVVLNNAKGDRLHIVNVNRTPVEETLGVDLVYYCEEYNSFVMVQYKMLDADGHHHFYRVTGAKDSRQRQKMIDAQRILRKQDQGTLTEYRLGDESIYYKLCYRRAPRSHEELIPGCYFAIDHWSRLLLDDRTKGPRDGKVVDINKCDRYLANTEFSLLVKHGWIGSRGIEPKQLEDIISACLDEKHSLTVAHKTRGVKASAAG